MRNRSRAIDDCTKIRVLKVFDDATRRPPSASQFHWHLETQDIRHVYIRPRTPRLNGKVERSHRVDDGEFYRLLDTGGISDDVHLFNEKLREWEDVASRGWAT